MNWKRISIYLIGMVILAFGLTLNTKTGLGVSPIISVPYAIATVFQISFAWTTFWIYVIFVIFQLLLTKFQSFWKMILQIPFSFLFSFLLDCFEPIPLQFSLVWQNLLLLLFAMICTAIGVSMMINMQLIPNPADGLADVLGQVLHKDFGYGKKILDASCVLLACIIGFGITHTIVGIGIGTIIAALGVGPIISLFQRICKNQMLSFVNN
ncbi:MAG: DUF6198 family protein [Erysipelotrichaceae bacterium]|nr:DUF6198 family protein [Erysipelotrichaceae bacterium]